MSLKSSLFRKFSLEWFKRESVNKRTLFDLDH